MSEVSVVIPTRNRLDFLRRSLACVLAQEGVDVEVLVVDEGSSDGTPSWLAGLGDARVRVLRHDEPKGLAGARNAGLAAATAPWVAFCDDDDLWAPGKLAAQLAAIAETPGARWSCVGTIRIDPHDEILGHQRVPASGDVSRLLRLHNAVPGGGSGLLMATDLAREVGGFDAWFTGCEDFEMAVKLSRAAPLAAVDRPLLGYRIWPDTMSTNIDYMHQGHRRVLERWQGEVSLLERRRTAQEEGLYFGAMALRKGERLRAARAYLKVGLRGSPRKLLSALGSLVAPRALEARHARAALREIPPAWVSEARAWLGSAVPVA